jgi:hypothetical protein
MTFNFAVKSALLCCALILSACGGGDDSATAAAGACKELTYGSAVSGSPYSNGQKVCFDATTSVLKFDTKTLTSPVQNTAVTAPNAAYTFVDGSGSSALCYEVAFTSGALREINVGMGSACTSPATFNFQGQFQ